MNELHDLFYIHFQITAFAVVFAAVFALLALISTYDKPVTPVASPPQYMMLEIKPQIKKVAWVQKNSNTTPGAW
jgi:hypothetical protein